MAAEAFIRDCCEASSTAATHCCHEASAHKNQLDTSSSQGSLVPQRPRYVGGPFQYISCSLMLCANASTETLMSRATAIAALFLRQAAGALACRSLPGSVPDTGWHCCCPVVPLAVYLIRLCRWIRCGALGVFCDVGWCRGRNGRSVGWGG